MLDFAGNNVIFQVVSSFQVVSHHTVSFTGFTEEMNKLHIKCLYDDTNNIQ